MPRFDLVAALASRRRLPRHGLHVIVESPGLAASLLAAGVPAARGGARQRGARGGGRRRCGSACAGSPRERPRLGGAASRRLASSACRWSRPATCAMLAAAEHDAHRVAVTAAAGELLERMPPSAFARARRVARGTGRVGAARARGVRRPPAARARPPRRSPTTARSPSAAGSSSTSARRSSRARRCPTARPGRGYLRAPRATPASRRRYGAPGAERRGARRARLEHRARRDRAASASPTTSCWSPTSWSSRARAASPRVGRGSGASSIVAVRARHHQRRPDRATGSTFERFLHPARRDCPDLDIDLCWRRRDEVIAHVYDTYGARPRGDDLDARHARARARRSARPPRRSACRTPRERARAAASRAISRRRTRRGSRRSPGARARRLDASRRSRGRCALAERLERRAAAPVDPQRRRS